MRCANVDSLKLSPDRHACILIQYTHSRVEKKNSRVARRRAGGSYARPSPPWAARTHRVSEAATPRRRCLFLFFGCASDADALHLWTGRPAGQPRVDSEEVLGVLQVPLQQVRSL